MEGPVLLVGSAHVVDLAGPLRATLTGRVIDAVAVELDAERAATVLSEGGRRTVDARTGPLFVRLWGVLQKRLGAEIGGGVAGAEMRTVARFARERNLPVFLIDDPLRETIGRLVRSMSLRERVSLLVGGVLGLFLPARFVERRLEDYIESPGEYLNEVRRAYPQVISVLLDGRNEHMADRLAVIRRRGYGRIAAVVGDAHLSGLSDALHRRGIPVEVVSLGALRRLREPPGAPSPGPGATTVARRPTPPPPGS